MENINIMDFINPAVIILIPILLGIGNILKGIGKIKDEYIPLLLGMIAIILSFGSLGIGYEAVIQGILLMLVTTGTHQLVKQGIKSNEIKESDIINVSLDGTKNIDDLISKIENNLSKQQKEGLVQDGKYE